MSIRHISLLGQPEVSVEGRPVRFRLKKALALLCYLAAEGDGHPRRELAELLWPQSDEQHARTDLRGVLAKLRKTLGEDGALGDAREGSARFFIVDGDLLGVEPRGMELDLRALEAAVELARSEAPGTPPGGGRGDGVAGRSDLIARLEGTLGIYRGEFLKGFSLEDAPDFELWLEAERERWRGVFGELCQRLSSFQVEAGETRKAIDTVRLWTRHAPLEEAPYRRLVELLSVAGDATGALLAYEDFRSALRRKLGLEPSSQMRELAERLRGEVEERAPLSVSAARSETTPTPLLAIEVPFAGRHEEFGALVSEYHTACAGDRAGQTRVVAVLGEAGIGKTRLADEFLGWAKARGADVLRGGASEGAGLPYGPLIEAIRPRIERERAPDDLLEDTWLSELSRLLPELKERYPDLPAPTSGEAETAKAALFEAIARTVGALASRAPVVLFLDDLQWADSTTIEVLDHAGSRWAEQGAPVLVLVAARPEESEGRTGLERWLSSSGRRLPVRSLALGPLGNEDVGGMLRRLVRAASESPAWPSEQPGDSGGTLAEPNFFVERLLAETGGQPFYLVETLKALLEDGKLVIRDGADGGSVVEVGPDWREGGSLRGLLPQSVREVIHARLTRLSATAFELLTAGAVLERGFGFESVVRMVGLGEVEGLRGLEELIDSRLLVEEDGGGKEEALYYADTTYSFSHEKIRQVAYTEGGRARRRVLHRRALQVLGEGSAPAAQLARHALAGGLAEQAFGYSVAAGDQAMEVFAVRDAIAHYERARILLPEEVPTDGAWRLVEPSVSDLEHLYTQLGRAHELTYEWDKAREAYERMRALGRRLGEARLEVVALNQLAVLRFPYQEIDLPNAKALLEDARRVAEEAGLTEALVETECNLADLMSFWAGEPEHARPPAENALASARSLVGRPDLIARTLWTLARVEMDAGRLEESAAYAEESAALSRMLAERPAPRMLLPSILAAGRGLVASWRAGTKAMEVRCLGLLALDRIWQGRLREGIKVAREAHGISRELPERAEAMGSWALGPGLVEAGEYEEGLELCRRGTEMARKLPNVFLLWYNLDNLGRACEALLDMDKARRVYEEALELSGPLGPRYEKFSSIKLCAVAVFSKNWKEAHARALRAREVATSFIRLDVFYLHLQVEALLWGGDERLARENVRRFTERAEVNGREGMAYARSLAVLSEWEGNTREAIDHLREAQTLADEIGLPGELWQIRSRIGYLHERRGDAEQAREAFFTAAQTLRALAQNIGDEEVRERFLSAPEARLVLERC